VSHSQTTQVDPGGAWERGCPSPMGHLPLSFFAELFPIAFPLRSPVLCPHHVPRWRANPVRGPWPGPVYRLRTVRAARAIRRREADEATRSDRQAHRSAPRARGWLPQRGALRRRHRSTSMTGARRCSSGDDWGSLRVSLGTPQVSARVAAGWTER
jgi:hypothetical protein